MTTAHLADVRVVCSGVRDVVSLPRPVCAGRTHRLISALFGAPNDQANHRIGLIAVPALVKDTTRGTHVRVQHVGFEYKSLDELLDTYRRLKVAGITPVLSSDHGATASNSLTVKASGVGRGDSLSFSRSDRVFPTVGGNGGLLRCPARGC